MVNQKLDSITRQAFAFAEEARHTDVTVEHLLVVLLNNSAALTVLNACDVDIEGLRQELTEYLKPSRSKVLPVAVQPTLGFDRVELHATRYIKGMQGQIVDGAHVLRSIFHEEDTRAASLLKEKGLDGHLVSDFVLYGVKPSR